MAIIHRLKPTINTDDCLHWARQVRDVLGLGFHPDTPFSDYIDVADESAVFSVEEAERLDGELMRVDSYYPGGIYRLWEDVSK